MRSWRGKFVARSFIAVVVANCVGEGVTGSKQLCTEVEAGGNCLVHSVQKSGCAGGVGVGEGGGEGGGGEGGEAVEDMIWC